MLDKLKSVEAEFKARMHKALSFDGKDDYVLVSNSPSLNLTNQITIVSWIYIPHHNVLGLATILNRNGLSNNWNTIPWQLRYSNTTFGIIIGNGYTYQSLSFGSVIFNKLIFIAGVITGKVLIGYQNGIKVGEINQAIIPTTTTNPLAIAKAGTRYDKINVAYLRIYNRALSKSEIKYLYNNPFDPLDKDHLVLDLTPAGIDIENSKWWDLSGKGNHGTIYGATEVKLTKPEVSVK